MADVMEGTVSGDAAEGLRRLLTSLHRSQLAALRSRDPKREPTIQHPLMLISALSLSDEDQKDGTIYLAHALIGRPPPTDIRRSVLRGGDSLDDHTLRRLGREDEYVDALAALSLAALIHARNPSAENAPALPDIHSLARRWQQIEAGQDPGGIGVDEVRWESWFVVNVHLLAYGDEYRRGSLFASLIMERMNDQIHNLREHWDHAAALAAQELNAALAADPPDPERLAAIGQRHSLAVRLSSRAYRFYLWDPMEIDSRQVGERVRRLIEERMRGGS